MKAYKNLLKARQRLTIYLDEPIQSDRDEAGIIKAFEFSFEMFWKYLQVRLESEGLEARSPRETFKQALSSGLLAESMEPTLLQMLVDRTLTVHTYDPKLAHEITERIRNNYYRIFDSVSE
jgi:nucleotidyltransferase substrate binding protein (TIGR01987 family)